MDRDITRAETRRSLLLWFGILAGPLAWTAQVALAPDINEVLCYPGAESTGRGELYGVPMVAVVAIFSAAMLAVSLLGLAASLSCWRRVRRGRDATPARRATWMAFAGVLVGALFSLAIAVGFIPLAFLDACERSL